MDAAHHLALKTAVKTKVNKWDVVQRKQAEFKRLDLHNP
jgi:hypothetical protein